MIKKTFASDNYSGVHPDIMDALLRANAGHVESYGGDAFTEDAIRKFQTLFGDDTGVYFVYNGTGANVLGLQALTRSFHSILCAELAHIQVDESTAPERFLGCKLVPVPARNGKMTPASLEEKIQRMGDQHHAQARVISLSQSTEYGTVYTIEELQAITELARKNDLFLHMDGSRIANAAVSLNADFRSFTRDAGVDVLSFGGTKNGMMFGEAVLVFNPAAEEYMKFFRKQTMQLHSKMRFISAQFSALLSDNLWKRNAEHANRMARLLEAGLKKIPAIQITRPVEANGVFAVFPEKAIKPMQDENFFYVWNERTCEVRLMCSFDTTEEEVSGFVERLSGLVGLMG